MAHDTFRRSSSNCLLTNCSKVVGCVLFGFITNFKQALALRILEGLVNGNVATIRTMVSEVVVEKR